MNPLVSIVIPVYNVEKYLDRCVRSVVRQTYDNLEILLIDDGSPDNCPQMCDAWAQIDTRIRVIHKQNAGLGMARNTGIENATGKYICFFDSDDYIIGDIIEEAVLLAENEKADMVLFGMCAADNDGKILRETMPTPAKMLYIGREIRTHLLPAVLGDDPVTGGSFG